MMTAPGMRGGERGVSCLSTVRNTFAAACNTAVAEHAAGTRVGGESQPGYRGRCMCSRVAAAIGGCVVDGTLKQRGDAPKLWRQLARNRKNY
jgi:hypothetical protein